MFPDISCRREHDVKEPLEARRWLLPAVRDFGLKCKERMTALRVFNRQRPCRADLPFAVDAINSPRRCLCLAQCRQQHARKNANNGIKEVGTNFTPKAKGKAFFVVRLAVVWISRSLPRGRALHVRLGQSRGKRTVPRESIQVCGYGNCSKTSIKPVTAYCEKKRNKQLWALMVLEGDFVRDI